MKLPVEESVGLALIIYSCVYWILRAVSLFIKDKQHKFKKHEQIKPIC